MLDEKTWFGGNPKTSSIFEPFLSTNFDLIMLFCREQRNNHCPLLLFQKIV